MNELEKTARMNWLLDLYGELLTEKQRAYMELYFKEDLSLKEIAEQYEVSRNAVYDLIKRGSIQLEKYEARLGLVEKHIKRQDLIAKIEAEESRDHEKLMAYLESLKEI